MNVSVKIYY